MRAAGGGPGGRKAGVVMETRAILFFQIDDEPNTFVYAAGGEGEQARTAGDDVCTVRTLVPCLVLSLKRESQREESGRRRRVGCCGVSCLLCIYTKSFFFPTVRKRHTAQI